MFVGLVVFFCQSQAKETGSNTASKNIKNIAMVSSGALHVQRMTMFLSLSEVCKQTPPVAGFEACIN